MKKRTKKIMVTLVTIFAMLMVSISSFDIAKATRPDDMTLECSYTKEGDTNTINVWRYNGEYLETDKIYSKDSLWVECGNYYHILSLYSLECNFDSSGTAWSIEYDNSISGWNYYIQNNNEYMPEVIYLEDKDGYTIHDAETLVYDENNKYVIGYKTKSGEEYSVLSYEEMERAFYGDEEPGNVTQTPLPSSAPTSPTKRPANTVKPIASTVPTRKVPTATSKPQVTLLPTATAEVSLIKNKKTSEVSICQGDTALGSYFLKKGTLKWKAGKKKGTEKKIKEAGYIKKSKKLIYVTKKGKAYTISIKGKKKCIVKKGAKGLKRKNKFVTKVKNKSGGLNVTNR